MCFWLFYVQVVDAERKHMHVIASMAENVH